MKRIILIFTVFALVFFACDTSGGTDVEDPVVENPVVDEPNYSNDMRLTAFGDAKSSVWIRYPTKASKSIRYNIADGDPAAALCTEPGWAYLFYNDGAVIGYQPYPERIDLVQYAVKLTVESHNMEKPEEEWGYINVPMPAPPPPDTSNDPVLGKWQTCFCLDDGTVVMGPLTAEFEWNWIEWKTGNSLKITLESYNLEHDPDAHIVWGTDE
jgi:hypothetical protein